MNRYKNSYFYKFRYIILIMGFISLYAFFGYSVFGSPYKGGYAVLALPIWLVLLFIADILNRQKKKK